MAVSTPIALLLTVCFLGIYVPVPALASSSDDFLQCLSTQVPSQLVLTPTSPSFKPLLVSSIRNARFVAPATARPPLCIVTPTDASHVQAAVRCGRAHGVRLRVRSGGHDNEGLSYLSQRPEVFAVLDLAKLHAVRVDPREATAWVDSGATVGELYYAVGKAAPGLGFPAGVCPTVGVGGQFSGGGQGLMMRMYGLASDNIIDAAIVDAYGNLLPNKKAMVLLLNRTMTIGPFVKNKSDYVKKALTNNTWHNIFTMPSGAARGELILEPHGGRMAKIADSDTPFPHRSGVLYNIQYVQFWNGNNSSIMPSWINGMYDYMAPFVTKNPRTAYSNYRDLDFGVNKVVGGISTYESGKVWGQRYFGANFRRLAMIKRNVDPADYFQNEQSVPPLLL